MAGRNYSNAYTGKYSRVPIGLQPPLDGGEFISEMVKVGIPIDTKNLDRMGGLINSGMTISKAILELKR